MLAILGPLSSAMAQSAADAAQAAGVPLIALSQKDGLTQTGNWIFQAFLTPRQQVRAVVRQGQSQGINASRSSTPILLTGAPFPRIFRMRWRPPAVIWPPGLLTAPAPRGSGPFWPPWLRVQTRGGGAPGATALFIPDDAAAVAAIAGGLAATPLKGIQLLGTNLLNNAKVPAAQLTALEGVILPDAFYAGDPNYQGAEIYCRLPAAVRRGTGLPGGPGLSVFRVMARVAESPQALSRMALPQKLLSLSGVPGLPWFQKFNAQREEETVLYLLTIWAGPSGWSRRPPGASRGNDYPGPGLPGGPCQ